MVEIIEAVLPNTRENSKVNHAYEEECVEGHNKQKSSLIEVIMPIRILIICRFIVFNVSLKQTPSQINDYFSIFFKG